MRLTTLPVTRLPQGEFLLHHGPGVGGELLQPQGDALFVPIEAQDLDRDGVPHLEEVGGVAHPAVGQVGDVEQAVQPAQVHEDAVVGDILDHARPRPCPLPGWTAGWSWLRFDFLQQDSAGEDDVAPFAVEFQDLEGSASGR